jgi:hypothetical protein
MDLRNEFQKNISRYSDVLELQTKFVLQATKFESLIHACTLLSTKFVTSKYNEQNSSCLLSTSMGKVICSTLKAVVILGKL